MLRRALESRSDRHKHAMALRESFQERRDLRATGGMEVKERPAVAEHKIRNRSGRERHVHAVGRHRSSQFWSPLQSRGFIIRGRLGCKLWRPGVSLAQNTYRGEIQFGNAFVSHTSADI